MVTVSEKNLLKRLQYHQRKRDGNCVDCGTNLEEGNQLTMCVSCRWRKKVSKIKHWGQRATDDGRKKDKYYNRYEAVKHDFIDKDYLHNSWDVQHNKCHHCKIITQPDDRCAHDGCTVERLDNSIGHSKANCVIACHACNCHRLCGDARSMKYLASRRIVAREHNTRIAVREVIDLLIKLVKELSNE